LVLRIRCDAQAAQSPLGSKFGCDPIAEGPYLIKAARDMDLEVVGINFHVGSGTGCTDYPIYYKAIEMAKGLFDYAESIGYKFNLLDIGGGFLGDKDKTLDEAALYVNQGLDHFFLDKSVKVIAEPGRYFVASAFTLVCNIQSKKTGNNGHTHMYFLNDGIYGSFSTMIYDHQHPQPKLLNPPLNAKEFDSTIYGPTCDSQDKMFESIRLPELDINDWVIFENMGAYTIPVASAFNGFPVANILYYIGEDVWGMFKHMIPESIGTMSDKR
jgi:ornithine decarboxylase